MRARCRVSVPLRADTDVPPAAQAARANETMDGQALSTCLEAWCVSGSMVSAGANAKGDRPVRPLPGARGLGSHSGKDTVRRRFRLTAVHAGTILCCSDRKLPWQGSVSVSPHSSVACPPPPAHHHLGLPVQEFRPHIL